MTLTIAPVFGSRTTLTSRGCNVVLVFVVFEGMARPVLVPVPEETVSTVVLSLLGKALLFFFSPPPAGAFSLDVRPRRR